MARSEKGQCRTSYLLIGLTSDSAYESPTVLFGTRRHLSYRLPIKDFFRELANETSIELHPLKILLY